MRRGGNCSFSRIRTVVVVVFLLSVLLVVWQAWSLSDYSAQEGTKHPLPTHELPMSERVANGHPPARKLVGKFNIQWPEKIHQCHREEIIFVAESNYDYMPAFMTSFHVEAECSDSEKNSFTRPLPVFLHPLSNDSMVAYLTPDGSTWQCRLRVLFAKQTNVDLKFTGSMERGYQVVLGVSYDETHCVAHLSQPVPIANDFLLTDAEGNYLHQQKLLAVESGDEMILWIVLHPFLLDRYPESAPFVHFNAFLSSFAVIRNAETDLEYDAQRHGYRLRIVGHDAGKFSLTVTLNWIYPLSEVHTNDHKPILLSSHGRHYVSELDLERSRIPASHHLTIMVTPLPGQQSTFIRPENSTQCTSASVEGRWLNVLPVGSGCQEPYCTGDRTGALIDGISWQGVQHPWIWVPYQCHYHFYSAQEISKCSSAAKIDWIHFMGDSLTRGFVSYLMAITGRTLPDKFNSFDNYIEALGLQISYSSWPKEIVEYPLDDPASGSELLLKKLEEWNFFSLRNAKNSPDVFFVNAANAEALRVQSKEQHRQWIQDFSMAMWGVLAKTRLFWHGNPYFHGQGHSNNDFITQARNAEFLSIAQELFRGSPVKVFQTQHVGQARPLESMDGLHWLSGTQGHVHATQVQMWLNELFAGIPCLSKA